MADKDKVNEAIELLVGDKLERIAAANVHLRKAQKWLLANIDGVLELVPKHNRTSCSDDNPGNSLRDGEAHPVRCTRCQLIAIRDGDYGGDGDWVVDVTTGDYGLFRLRYAPLQKASAENIRGELRRLGTVS